jgi:hypothetical protein
VYRPINVTGPEISPDFLYQTEFGAITRFDLVDQFAHTVQGCLAILSSQYTPHAAGELIMRSVISLLSASGTDESDYVISKLENGLSSIGYYPYEQRQPKPTSHIIPELHVDGQFPADADEWCRDGKTGAEIGFNGVLRYLDTIDLCLEKSECFRCDQAARKFVLAVKLLVQPDPASRKQEIEDLLWQAVDGLGFHLDIAPWNKRRQAASN